MKNRRDFLADTATLAVAGSVLLNSEARAQAQAPSNAPPRDPNQLPGHTDFVLSPQADPYELLTKWLDDAGTAKETDPTAVALATVDASGMPDVRMMHFNGMRDGRFLIQLETNTPKGDQLRADPRAALMFYWRANGRQVRIRGNAEQWSDAMADMEWANDTRRPRVAKVKISAWDQSQVFEKSEELEQRLRDMNERVKGTVPRPPKWSGYSVTPLSIEFWQPNPATLLHERLRFIRARGNAKWRVERLVP